MRDARPASQCERRSRVSTDAMDMIKSFERRFHSAYTITCRKIYSAGFELHESHRTASISIAWHGPTL